MGDLLNAQTNSTETSTSKTDKPVPAQVNDDSKIVKDEKTSEQKTTVSQTAPVPTPTSLVPAAPLATEQPAPKNEQELAKGQASTNPAQGKDLVTNASQAQEAALKALADAGVDATAEPEEDEIDTSFQRPDELTMLKSRASVMGITYSNNIGVETLREKIAAKLAEAEASEENTDDEDDDEDQDDESFVASSQPTQEHSNVTGENPETAALIRNPTPAKKLNLRQHLMQEEMKLVRLRITNLDPKKKDLPGEILTVANEFIGTVKKYIPYGEVTDGGYHVPYCLYTQLRDRQFLSIKTRKGPRGQVIVEDQMAKEFALEVLPPLTAEELARLSAAQLASGGVE